MSYLRFSRVEYEAVSAITRPLNLNRYRPLALKRLLAQSLAAALPELAERIGRFRRQEIRILHDYFRCQQRPPEVHELTAEELAMLAEAFGPVLFQVRFLRPLKSALVHQFRDAFPDLAAKLGRLSNERFEALCDRIKQRVNRDA